MKEFVCEGRLECSPYDGDLWSCKPEETAPPYGQWVVDLTDIYDEFEGERVRITTKIELLEDES